MQGDKVLRVNRNIAAVLCVEVLQLQQQSLKS